MKLRFFSFSLKIIFDFEIILIIIEWFERNSDIILILRSFHFLWKMLKNDYVIAWVLFCNWDYYHYHFLFFEMFWEQFLILFCYWYLHCLWKKLEKVSNKSKILKIRIGIQYLLIWKRSPFNFRSQNKYFFPIWSFINGK